ncbi:EamA family transporter [Candidatus Bathyarchaeota archaeon]|nr:EamA family transporter [Candidatus Bathyarchaeota archaeon]
MKTRRLALTEGILAGALFGTAAIFIRFLGKLDAFYIAFWRLVIACLVVAVMLVFLGSSFQYKSVKKNLRQLFILSFFLSLHFILFVSAVKDTSILNATVLVNTTPIFSVFISSFVFNVKPSRLALLGLTISFVGVLVIFQGETMISGLNNTLNVFSTSLKGNLEAVLAAVVEAFYLNYGVKTRKRMNILPIMFPIYILTAAIIGILAIPVTDQIMTLPTEMTIILPLIGLGVLPTAMAHTLYFSSLSNLKSFETATMALLEPVGATILGILLFQENPPQLFLFGAGLVLLGILFIAKKDGWRTSIQQNSKKDKLGPMRETG